MESKKVFFVAHMFCFFFNLVMIHHSSQDETFQMPCCLVFLDATLRSRLMCRVQSRPWSSEIGGENVANGG